MSKTLARDRRLRDIEPVLTLVTSSHYEYILWRWATPPILSKMGATITTGEPMRTRRAILTSLALATLMPSAAWARAQLWPGFRLVDTTTLPAPPQAAATQWTLLRTSATNRLVTLVWAQASGASAAMGGHARPGGTRAGGTECDRIQPDPGFQ